MYKLLISTFALFCLISLGDTEFPEGICNTSSVVCVVDCNLDTQIIFPGPCPDTYRAARIDIRRMKDGKQIMVERECGFDPGNKDIDKNFRTQFEISSCYKKQ